MSHINQLLGTAIGTRLIDGLLYKHFVSKLVSLIILTVITGIMASLCIIWLGYAIYRLLVQYHMDPEIVFDFIGMGAVSITAICAGFCIYYAKKLGRMLQPLSYITEGAHDIASAFREGFKSHSNSEALDNGKDPSPY